MNEDTDLPPNSIIDTIKTNNNTALASISAIALRIQEKADALTTERQTLQEIQTKIQSISELHNLQLSKNKVLQYDVLQQTKTKIGLEIEVARRDDRIRELKRKILARDSEMEDLKQHIQSLQNQADREVEDVFAPHLVTIESFQRNIEQNLNEHNERRRKRQHTFDSFVAEREKNLESVKDMKRHQEKLEMEIEVMKQVEVAEDEEIAALAMQIKATLSKRTSLRGALEDGRKRNRVATEKMIQWEEECMKYSNHKAVS
jgi:chromosome segregation ATPase